MELEVLAIPETNTVTTDWGPFVGHRRKMASFPLYDELLSHGSKESMRQPPADWSDLIRIINGLSTEQLRIIYALITHHYLSETTNYGEVSETLLGRKRGNPYVPYKGKVVGTRKGLNFTVRELPVTLQHVIANYLRSFNLTD